MAYYMLYFKRGGRIGGGVRTLRLDHFKRINRLLDVEKCDIISHML